LSLRPIQVSGRRRALWRDHPSATSPFASALCVADAALRLECSQELPLFGRALILSGAFTAEQQRTERAGQQRSPGNEQSGMRHRSRHRRAPRRLGD